MFKKFLLVAICTVVVSAVPALATFERIEVVLEFGMHSSYLDATKTQTLISTNGARAYFDTGDEFDFSTTDALITATGAVDGSSGGVAAADFSGGTWHLELLDGDSDSVFYLSGTIDWYNEDEDVDFTNKVNGVGKVSINSGTKFIDESFWGLGVDWAATDGKSAIITSISGAQQNGGSLLSYTDDWSSQNVILILWADSSKAVPEPATMCLLSLGGLLLRKRKTKS